MKAGLTFFCFIFFVIYAFPQTPIYSSDSISGNHKDEVGFSSIYTEGDLIIADSFDHRLMAIDKTNHKTIWNIDAGFRSRYPIYFYKAYFFYPTQQEGVTRMAQYNVNTGRVVRTFPFEIIASKPYFIGSTMYFTGLMDGSKMLAYDIDKNQKIWEKPLGPETAQAIFFKDKIIVNADEGQWTEMDYNGDLLPAKSRKSVAIDTTVYKVKTYEFLTHDGKKITKQFLKKKKFGNLGYLTEIADENTFLLSETRLLVLKNNRKVQLDLDLETLVSSESYDHEAITKIIKTETETLWSFYQNHLIHYDFKNKKSLRHLDLNKWRPRQLILDNRTIWLISNNDGQIYALDFEPDGVVAEKTAREKAIQDRLRCDFPDPKRIKAAKAAEEIFVKNKNRYYEK